MNKKNKRGFTIIRVAALLELHLSVHVSQFGGGGALSLSVVDSEHVPEV